jgi:hypothetical protein
LKDGGGGDYGWKKYGGDDSCGVGLMVELLLLAVVFACPNQNQNAMLH